MLNPEHPPETNAVGLKKKQHFLPKDQKKLITQHGVKSQKTSNWVTPAVKS